MSPIFAYIFPFLLFIISLVLLVWGLRKPAIRNFHSQPASSRPAKNRFCPQCGRALKKDEAFCPKCGTYFSSSTNTQTHSPGEMPKRSIGRILGITAGVMLLFLAVMLVLKSFGISLFQDSKINRYPPFQVFELVGMQDQADQYRYAMADMQLGGKGVEKYYRDNAVEVPMVAIASAWYEGERVVNVYQFDRIQWQNIWAVVYGGTQEVIQAADVVLTSDIRANGNDEARIRYILADAQLGEVIEYYRQYTDDPVIAEAVRRWDNGVRVANIDLFERLIVVHAGWKVVYRATLQVINANDIALTSDQAPDLVDACSTDEGRIVYIIADIQLGDVEGYYRQHAEEPLVAEALRRWEAGIRVANPENFERRSLDETGWAITYAGSNTRIDCSAIQLSQETDPTAPVATCHKYFPAAVGFGWTYEFHMDVTTEETYTGIIAVTPSGSDMLVETLSAGSTGARPGMIRCSPKGVFDEYGGSMLIPGEDLLYDGYTYMVGDFAYVVGFETISVPAGTFDTLRICSATPMGDTCNYYAERIGLVLSSGPEHSNALVKITLP